MPLLAEPTTAIVYKSNGIITNCPNWFVHGQCSNGHQYAKEIYCGREWCPVCGLKNSTSHNRRLARWLPYLQQIDTMGYFVFTISTDIRHKYRTKQSLNKLLKSVILLLKDFGYSKGLARYHWFGDKSTTYNPHINIIVPGTWCNPQTLSDIKTAYAALLNIDYIPNVNYNYKHTSAEKYSSLEYITRSTFTNFNWSPSLANELYNFRNNRVWGFPPKKDAHIYYKWHLNNTNNHITQLSLLENKICPICKEQLKWSPVLPIQILHLKKDIKPIYNGYYSLDTS